MKEITMTLQEFLFMHRGEAEEFATQIRKNKRLENLFVFATASLMYTQNVLAAANTAQIDKIGFTLLGVCRQFGYWACIILAAIEIIKGLMQGDTHGVSKIISKYVLGFSALYFLPWIFDVIKAAFAN